MTAILVAGNCQAQVVAAWLRLMLPDVQVHDIDYGKLLQSGVDLTPPEDKISHVFAARGGTFNYFTAPDRALPAHVKIYPYPAVFFSGYHPDTIYPDPGGSRALSPTGTNHSALTVYGWLKGYTVEDTARLFNARVFQHLGYFDHFEAAKNLLFDEGRACGMPLEEAFQTWIADDSPFVHTPNHPKPKVLLTFARALARQAGFEANLSAAANVADPFERLIGWPLYPDIAERFGLPGGYSFRLIRPAESAEPARRLELEAYIAESFKMYDRSAGEGLAFERLNDPRYNDLPALTLRRQAARPRSVLARPEASANPYRGLSDRHFWSRSVARPPPAAVDPTSGTAPQLTPTTRIATAGSCFAQHIAANLKRRGYTYMITDAVIPADVRPEIYQNSSQFSARYGNIYSSRQLIQLVERAYGRFTPCEDIWRTSDGRFIDALRPQIVEGGFLTEMELLEDRERHFAAVREMFETLEVMIFTLGLTEIWQSKTDGLVTPVAPGVVADAIYQEGFEFHNLDIDEVDADLTAFVSALGHINPSAQVILTVSPVPLIATYTDDHVLAATTYSKSVLRVAAERCARRNEHVRYFPSYEIITSPSSRGRYFENDLRSVKPEGVEHVMRTFFNYFAGERAPPALQPESQIEPSGDGNRLRAELNAGMKVICDELLNEANEILVSPTQN